MEKRGAVQKIIGTSTLIAKSVDSGPSQPEGSIPALALASFVTWDAVSQFFYLQNEDNHSNF